MAKQTVNLGVVPDGAGGEDVRTGFTKVNANFTELYTPPTQAEAEAGTSQVVRGWTAERIRQAITAWFASISGTIGRAILSRSTAAQVRDDLGLGTAATATLTTSDADGTAGSVLRVGNGGWMKQGSPQAIPYGYPTSMDEDTNQTKVIRADAYDIVVPPFASGIHFSALDTWGRLRVAHDVPAAWIQGGQSVAGTGWTAVLYHSGNTLNIGKTPATARAALELTGEWVDLRPYLKPGFYWNPLREGKNSHPRIRKLSCGRVELDGVVSFNETSGPTPVGVFVNVPVEFRPPYTCAGLAFADTAEPLSFGAANWIVAGVVEYSPPAVSGDIAIIPLTIASLSRDGALSLNNIFWHTV